MQKETSLSGGSSTPGSSIGSYTWHLSLRVDRPVEVRRMKAVVVSVCRYCVRNAPLPTVTRALSCFF
jgi:hypothetical protein